MVFHPKPPEWLLTVALHADDEEKTEFSTSQHLWQFTVVPSCLCNAPAIFQWLMETVLRVIRSQDSQQLVVNHESFITETDEPPLLEAAS
jgi:hypothetical protein